MDDAVEWYEEQASGFGKAFLDEIDNAIRRIVAWPFSCAEISPSIRRCLVSRFPYGIIYGCEEEVIVDLAVAHLHREPRYWVARKS